MPESRRRRRRGSNQPVKGGPTAPKGPVAAAAEVPQVSDDAPRRTADVRTPNPPWYVPVMLGLMVLGLAWIVVWYVTENRYPVPGIGSWNLVAGFAVVLVGFLMTTRWR